MSLPRASSSLIVTAPLASAVAGRAHPATGSAYNYRVLMAKRISTGSFESAYVFPGGVEEKEDSSTCALFQGAPGLDQHKVCAVRETFEETGLLACDPAAATLDIAAARSAGLSFHELCAKHSFRPLDVKQIGRWITPRAQKKRFDTRFYMLNIGERDEFLVSQLGSSAVQQSELVCLDWFTPGEVLEANARSEFPLFPPQFCVLKELSRYSCWQDLAAASAKSFHLSTPEVPIEPVVKRRSDGAVVGLYPGDRAYPLVNGTAGRLESPSDADLFCSSDSDPGLHRIEMWPAKSGGFLAGRLLRTISALPNL
ncbi:hypothetical protein GQ54DRAFT_257419 [Martensiomyces pterosporus]|nr:hypothetical protein GQ54DRAFT_257419 [Martensiomyces pterosporus]